MDLWNSDPDKLPNRGLHLEATIENPSDSDIIINNARDDNMVTDSRLTGTENIEGLHQSSSSIRKRFEGDDDDSTSDFSLSAGSFDERRRVQ